MFIVRDDRGAVQRTSKILDAACIRDPISFPNSILRKKYLLKVRPLNVWHAFASIALRSFFW